MPTESGWRRGKAKSKCSLGHPPCSYCRASSLRISSMARKLPSGQQLVTGTGLLFKETTVVVITWAKIKVGNISPSHRDLIYNTKAWQAGSVQATRQDMRSSLMQPSSLNHAAGANKTGLQHQSRKDKNTQTLFSGIFTLKSC